jgi:hypothetical protein
MCGMSCSDGVAAGYQYPVGKAKAKAGTESERLYDGQPLNALHPFREGNGQAQREFISQLAHANSYHVAWRNIPPPICWPLRLRLFRGNTSGMAGFIRRNLSALEQDG